ncbi:hypothetical protein [Pseudoalteromonas sp. MMG005]|uniref:hypothetical protein n=1 Tax=Pseudoalteromonas sp. MMG005 TaxID=2822682 RepID=UPI001B39E32E|nr:hypothetical protein [Pseudoalteromonas sp. MMG005]MBQ4844706.1 hypothetical protein [Pseudoalteromonas sp. MMG005]
MKRLILSFSCLAAATHAHSTPSTSLEVGYSQLNISDLDDLKVKGPQLSVKSAFPAFYLTGVYRQLTTDMRGFFALEHNQQSISGGSDFDIDVDFIELGIGKMITLSDTSYLNIHGYLSKISLDVDGHERYTHITEDGTVNVVYDEPFSESDSVDLLTFKVHYRKYIDQFYLEAGIGAESDSSVNIKRVKSEGSETNLILSAEFGYNFNSQWATNVRYFNSKDYSITSANISYNF